MEIRKNQKSARTIFSEFKKEVINRPFLSIVIVTGSIASQLMSLAIPVYMKALLNTLALNQVSPAIVNSLYHIVTIIGIIMILRWVWYRIQMWNLSTFESKAMANLTLSSFQYLIHHSQYFFSSQFAGTLTRRINKYANSFETLIDSFVMNFLPTVTFVVGAIIILFNRNHVLGITLGIWVIIFVLIQIYTSRLHRVLRVKRAEQDSKVAGGIADAIGNSSGITLFSAEVFEVNHLSSLVSLWYKAQLKSWRFTEYVWGIQGFLILGINVVLLYIAVFFWAKGELTIGDFILIQTYLVGTFDMLSNITGQLRRFYDGLADAGEMMDILNAPHEIADSQDAKDISITDRVINFGSVGFHFNADRAILTDFNLVIQGGQKVALVGPSGAGKSTITKLLLRLYDVTDGSIEIDGQDIRQVTQESLRNAIGFVPQEPILFHRSLMENIRYGKRDATDEEVYEAARKAHCHEFISRLSDGYNTLVGERGVKLSGGERQRIAIARAILKNAPILILDEATSSLDSESEMYIQDSLKVLMEGKTVIVIAHRLSTIMNMDRIVVLEGGQIVADGTHTELLTQNGLYQKLWSIQAGGFLSDEEEVELSK